MCKHETWGLGAVYEDCRKFLALGLIVVSGPSTGHTPEDVL